MFFSNRICSLHTFVILLYAPQLDVTYQLEMVALILLFNVNTKKRV